MRLRAVIYMFICTMISIINCYGQEPAKPNLGDLQKADSTWYMIVLKDGTSLTANILMQDQKTMIVSTQSLPRLELAQDQIVSVKKIQSVNIKSGEYRFPNPNETRYLFAPSAINLKKGDGYYQNTYLLLHSFNYGITDNFSIGGGFEFLSTLGVIGDSYFNPICFLTPKLGFQVQEKLYLGVGMLIGNIPGMTYPLIMGYGLATYGDTEDNMTLGVGMGTSEFTTPKSPVFTLSGMTRISKRMSLITENWILPLDIYQPIFSYGIRFSGEQMSADFALINNAELSEGFFLGIPYVDFVVKF